MSGHNIWFRPEIRKIIIKYSLLPRALLLVMLFMHVCSNSLICIKAITFIFITQIRSINKLCFEFNKQLYDYSK